MQARQIRPRNWARFQHYTTRRPAWIKLHRDLLDDYEFACLPVASRALAPLLWLIASEDAEGTIDADAERLSFRLRWKAKEVGEALDPLIEKGFFECLHDASDPLADGKQNGVSEKEKIDLEERERERRKEEAERLQAVFDYWRTKLDHPQAKLDDKRRALIRRALATGYTREDLCNAIDGCAASAFHMGQNDQQRKFDGLELILRDAAKIDNFISLANQKPSRLGRAGTKTAAAARDWIEEGGK